MTTPTLTYREAALRVLKERGPMHYQDLAEAEAKVGKVWRQTTVASRRLRR